MPLLPICCISHNLHCCWNIAVIGCVVGNQRDRRRVEHGLIGIRIRQWAWCQEVVLAATTGCIVLCFNWVERTAKCRNGCTSEYWTVQAESYSLQNEDCQSTCALAYYLPPMVRHVVKTHSSTSPQRAISSLIGSHESWLICTVAIT